MLKMKMSEMKIALALNPINGAYHDNNPQLYLQYFDEHHLNKIEYPVNPTEMPQLEVTLYLSINLYIYFDDMGKAIYPMYISRHNSPRHIGLLYFNKHYAWIKTSVDYFRI